MTDTLLIEQCKQNNRKAQMHLYENYCDGMYTIACRYLKDPFEAEDALQDAFIKAFLKLDLYKGDVTFGAWLKRVVINTCLDKIKTKKAMLVPVNEELLHVVAEDDSWEVETGVTVAIIKTAIEKLPEKYRYATMLFLMEGYDHSEIAEILNITESASRTIVHRAKKQLQQQLKSIRNGTRS